MESSFENLSPVEVISFFKQEIRKPFEWILSKIADLKIDGEVFLLATIRVSA